jgi:hypothetical protein
MPYVISLVTLGYDPKRWFNEPREFFNREGSEFDYYTRYGKMYFAYNPSVLSALNYLRENASVLFIIRPDELGLHSPTHQIYDPNGTASLWICEMEIIRH